MGLDMYLNARKYVGAWNHSTDAEKKQFNTIMDAMNVDRKIIAQGSPHLHVELCVAYWRKANAIHKWFVDNCQDGKDECQNTYVEREKLAELLATCKQVMLEKDAIVAGNVTTQLPPQAGFFFGGTEIDEGYWFDIQGTINQLTRILECEALNGYDFQYHSSW